MKSKLSVLFLFVVYLFFFKYFSNYDGLLRGSGDCWGYYIYLPSSFIYHDLNDLHQCIQKRSELRAWSVQKDENGNMKVEEAPKYNGHSVIKYTCGVAILYSPFFFLAHAYCKWTHAYPADGFSAPYNFMIALSSLLYSIIGLWFLRKLLAKYFSDTLAALTLLSIGIGTNLFYFSVLNFGMSHTYLFALYALLLFATDRYYESGSIKFILVIAFCCGFITLIRPVEILSVLIPLLWNVTSTHALNERIAYLIKNCQAIGIFILVCVMINLPQLFYWHATSGKWLYDSYPSEKFDFLHPHIKEGLFGFSNGWLPYTPIMFFSLAGLLLLPKYFKQLTFVIALYLPLYIYLIYSWWCWQYVNGFGSRPMIEIYPLLAFPFVCLLQWCSQKKWIMIPLVAIMIFLCYVNVFQTWQWMRGLIWTEDANAAFYQSMFLKTKSSYKSLLAYDCGELQPDEQDLGFVKVLGENSFEDSSAPDYIRSLRNNSKYAFELHKGTTPALHFTPVNTQAQTGDYIKISCWVFCNALQYDHYRQAVLTAEFKHRGHQIRWRIVRMQNKIHNTDFSIWNNGVTGEWAQVSFFTKVPHRFTSAEDELIVMAWNPGDVAIIVDDIRVELWKKK